MTSDHVVQDQRDVIAFLGAPATHGGAEVDRIDTHGAVVFLAGDRVYKIKRAVAFPYMDFSTLERRLAACEAEVRLNRRTAPEIYLGILPIVRDGDGRLALGESDSALEDVVEWAVLMRRFAQSAIFDAMAKKGALTDGHMRGLAEAVSRFHSGAEARPIDEAADRMRAIAEENIAELREDPDLFAADAVDELETRTRKSLDTHAALLDRRGRDGKVRHCHGDLHLRNICLIDGSPVLFDAIEFNDDLAITDVFYDLAFLLMDLDHRGLRPLASAVLNRYLEQTADYDGLAVLGLFQSVRAAVRAKVAASMTAVQASEQAVADLRAEAAEYLQRAVGYLNPAPPRLVAVSGLSGTGKTTLARQIAPALDPPPGAVVLRSDVIRKQLAGVPETEMLPQAAYSRERSATVYETMYNRAEAILEAGYSVIADAVFALLSERQQIERAAADVGVRFDGLWLEAEPLVMTRRVEDRGADASDATADVVARQLCYETGQIGWPRLVTEGLPENVVLAAKELLGIADS